MKPIIPILLLLATVAIAQPTNPPPSFTLTWTAPPVSTNYVVASYNVYMSGVPGTNGLTNVVSIFGATNTTATVTNVVRGNTYYFAVTAKGTNGLESVYSNEIQATSPTPPSAPTSIQIQAQ